MVVALLVFVTLKSEEAVQNFVNDIADLYKYVRSTEAQTLTYEIHVSRDDKKKLTILERYVSDEALDSIHCKSPQFVDFSTRLREGFNYVSDVKVERMSEPEAAVQLRLASASASSENGVLVFCGSRAGAKPQYVAEAEALGREMSKRGLFLVYGAGTVGVMGALAKSFLAAAGPGAIIKSVIPRALAPKEISGEMIGQVILTDTMAERKTVLLANAKRVIALPGGLGTFDELFEALTLQQLGAIKVKIGVLNVEHYFDPFLAMLENSISEGFVEETARGYFVVAESAAALLDAMDRQPDPVTYNLKW